ncbi:MAG: hypothetical protein ABF636_00315 [Acetobacter sp.]
MKSFHHWRMIGLVPMALLAACSAQQCDPNHADLFTGIGCSAGSGYQQRTATLNTQRDLLRAEAEQAQDNATAAQNKAAIAQNSVTQERARLQAFKNKNAALRKQLSQLAQQNRISPTQYQNSLNTLNSASKMANSHDATKAAEAAKQQDALVDTLSQL